MDSIRVGTHCFGSREGYRTLSRSADVTDAEDAELRGFGFGQTADHSFLESLEQEPSAFGRPLTGGRVAITRIFQGDPDEAGRATLELRTILVAAPDIAPLAKAGLGAILQLPGLWKREAFRRGVLREIVVPEALAMPTPGDGLAAAALFEAWAGAVLPERTPPGEALSLVPAEMRPVIVAEPEPLGSAAISSIAAQLPAADLARLRWGVRLVSTAGPVDLCTLAPAGRAGGRRDTQRIRLDDPSASRSNEAAERPLALARVAAERAWTAPRDAASTSVLRPLAITLGTLLGLLLIAWITWIWISAALEGDPRSSGDSMLASAPVAASGAANRSEIVAAADPSRSAETTAATEPDRSPSLPQMEGGASTSDAIDDAAASGEAASNEAEPSVVEPSEAASNEAEPSEAPSNEVEPGEAASNEAPALIAETPQAIEPPSAEPSADDTVPPPAEVEPSPAAKPATSDAEAAEPSSKTDPDAIPEPTDPCEARAALAGRLAEIAEDARRAEAFRDREALERAAGEYAEAVRAIGLADVDPDVQPRVMARVRDRPGSAVSMPGDWPWWRELICQLEVLQVALANFDDVASRLGGRGAATRQELMRLRKDSCWILGSERAEAAALREAIARLRRNLAADCLAAQPSKEEQAQVEAIRAWLLLDASASPGGGEGRFDPPGGPMPEKESP